MFPLKSIMETDVSIVHPETHIFVAMNLFVKEGLTGVPVVDVTEKLVGFLSEKDVLKMLVSGETADRLNVSHYMSTDIKTFGPDESAVDACEFFMRNPIHMLPITDEEGKYLGIVRRRDIIFLILRIRGKIYRKKR